ncbi:Autotransporter beta-domain [Candidatus Hepatincola sp. Pdp]
MNFKIVWFLLLTLCLGVLHAETFPDIFPDYIIINPSLNGGNGEKVYNSVTLNLSDSYLLQEGTFTFYNSTINAGTADFAFDANGCSTYDPDGVTCKTLKQFTLILDNTQLFAGDSTIHVKDVVKIELRNGSVATIDKITTYNLDPTDPNYDSHSNTGLPAAVDISVYDSSLFINEINITAENEDTTEHPSGYTTSSIGILRFYNADETSKSMNTSTINGAIDDDCEYCKGFKYYNVGDKVAIVTPEIGSFELTNYVLAINGDVLAGEITNFTMYNSDLTFGGATFGEVGTFSMDEGSNFLMTDPDAVMVFDEAGLINMEGSTFQGTNIVVKNPAMFIIGLNDSSFIVDDISFYNYESEATMIYGGLTLDADAGSTVDIGTLDLTNAWQNPVTDPEDFNLVLNGSSSSNIHIGEIKIENDTTIDLTSFYGNIDLITINNDELSFNTKDAGTGSDSDIQIGEVDFTSDSGNAKITTNNITMYIGNLHLYNTTDFDFYATKADTTFTTIDCNECNIINFHGDSSKVTINDFNNAGATASTQNNFSGGLVVVTNSYNSAGTITLDDGDDGDDIGAVVLMNGLHGHYSTFNVSENSVFYIGGESKFTLDSATIEQGSTLIINSDDAFINEDNKDTEENEGVTITNSGTFVLNGADTFSNLNNTDNAITLLNGGMGSESFYDEDGNDICPTGECIDGELNGIKVDTINNDGYLYLSNGVYVDSITSSNTMFITGDVYVNNITFEGEDNPNTNDINEGNQLNFIILDNAESDEWNALPNSTLHVEGEITGLENTDVNVYFQHTSIFLPGVNNYFTLITNDSGALMNPKSFAQLVYNETTYYHDKDPDYNGNGKNLYPAWLNVSFGISNNNADNTDVSQETSLFYWSSTEDQDREHFKHLHINTDANDILHNLAPNFIADKPDNGDKDDKEDGGQSIWIEVERLTDYETLITATGNPYAEDQSLVNLAKTIDNIIVAGDVTEGLNDVVNSLDYNSGCGASDQIIYDVHNGNADNIDVSDAPCVITMSQNMETLKPINNEIFLISTHNQVSKDIYNMATVNRSYNQVGEVKVWGTNNLNYDNAQNKDWVTGYSSYGDTVQLGITGAVAKGFNLTGAIGFNVTQLNGNDDLYDSGVLGFSYGASASYVLSHLYMSLSALMATNMYNNNRNVYFLNNATTSNSSIESTSNTHVNEIIGSFEIGTELPILTDTFIVPKFFVSEGFISDSDYSESGSSGSLDVRGFSTPMTEVGIGVDLYRELLLPVFLGQTNAFWYPKINVSLVERIYNAPNTNYSFIDTGDDYITTAYGADYSGMLAKFSGGLEYSKEHLSISLDYYLDIGVAGYMDTTIAAQIKYSL